MISCVDLEGAPKEPEDCACTADLGANSKRLLDCGGCGCFVGLGVDSEKLEICGCCCVIGLEVGLKRLAVCDCGFVFDHVGGAGKVNNDDEGSTMWWPCSVCDG